MTGSPVYLKNSQIGESKLIKSIFDLNHFFKNNGLPAIYSVLTPWSAIHRHWGGASRLFPRLAEKVGPDWKFASHSDGTRAKWNQKSLRVVTFHVGDESHTSAFAKVKMAMVWKIQCKKKVSSLQRELKSNNGFQSHMKEIISFVFIIK